MSVPVHYVFDGDTLPIFFDSFDGGTGASITITGLAVTDIEIYKGTSMTQRASDNGYSLIDTDGIDLDGTTGIQGFAIDFSDNSDSGFYATGSWFNVVLASITVDGQTVNFVAARVYLMTATRGLTGTAVPAIAAEAAGGLYTRGSGAGQINQSNNGQIDVDAQRVGGTVQTAGDLAALLNTIDGIVDTILVDTGTTLDNLVDDLESRLGTPGNLGGGATIADNLSDMAGATFSASTDSQEAIRNAMALATKLQAYVQLLARKDSAIATDKSTELSEINANEGTGAGAYDNTTDSGEGLKDTGVASVAGAVGSVTGNVGGNVVGTVGELATQAKADVNAEVVDVIDTDTISEPSQGQPPATPSLRTMFSWWWMDWRNASNAIATERRVKNNAGTVLAKAPLSDDATTFEKDKWVSGP